MGTKTVRLDEDVYERIRAHKRDDETFSEVISRLVNDWTLVDYDTGRSEDEIQRHRDAIEASEQAGIEDTEEALERMSVEPRDE